MTAGQLVKISGASKRSLERLVKRTLACGEANKMVDYDLIAKVVNHLSELESITKPSR